MLVTCFRCHCSALLLSMLLVSSAFFPAKPTLSVFDVKYCIKVHFCPIRIYMIRIVDLHLVRYFVLRCNTSVLLWLHGSLCCKRFFSYRIIPGTVSAIIGSNNLHDIVWYFFLYPVEAGNGLSAHHPYTVTHPCINHAHCRVTSFS